MRRERSMAMWSVVAATGLLLSAMAHEAPGVTINEDNTNTVQVTDLTGFMTTGSDMVGMQVTAFFNSGASETVAWTASGPGNGQALGTGWTLRESGDTFGSSSSSDVGLWRVGVGSPNVFIDRLQIDGVDEQTAISRGTVFDRTQPAPFGTDGSYRGRDFAVHTTATVVGFDPGFDDFIVTYADPIDSQADGPGVVGDLFGRVIIDPIKMSGDVGFFYSLNELTFHMDTDTVGIRNPDVPPGPEFPEPASLALLSLSMLMLGRNRRSGVTGARGNMR